MRFLASLVIAGCHSVHLRFQGYCVGIFLSRQVPNAGFRWYCRLIRLLSELCSMLALHWVWVCGYNYFWFDPALSARLLRSCRDLVSLLCWLTKALSWSSWLSERFVVLLDPYLIILVSSSSMVLLLVVESKDCCSSLWCWSVLQFALSGTNCWDCTLAVFRFVLSQARWSYLCQTHFKSEGRCRLHRSEDSLPFPCLYLSRSSAVQFSLSMGFYVVPVFPYLVSPDMSTSDGGVNYNRWHTFASNLRTIVVCGSFPAILYDASLPLSKILTIVSSKILATQNLAFHFEGSAVQFARDWGRLKTTIRADPSSVHPVGYPRRKCSASNLFKGTDSS